MKNSLTAMATATTSHFPSRRKARWEACLAAVLGDRSPSQGLQDPLPSPSRLCSDPSFSFQWRITAAANI